MKNLKFMPYAFWIVAFTVIPLFLICYFAFTNPSFQFTFENIKRIGDFLDVLWRSLLLAFIATAVCLVLSYPFAYFISKSSKNKTRTMLILIMLPMWSSLLLRTYAWMTLLEHNGLVNKALSLIGLGPFKMINTSFAVIIGMVYDFLPFMIIPIYNAMSKIDENLINASFDLGANEFITLKKVILPLSLPGIMSGITMVFVPAASTFVISRLLGGGKNLLIGDLIESQFVGAVYNPWFGSALSLLLMVVILLILGLSHYFDKKPGVSK